jgi:hypothetical protein
LRDFRRGHQAPAPSPSAVEEQPGQVRTCSRSPDTSSSDADQSAAISGASRPTAGSILQTQLLPSVYGLIAVLENLWLIAVAVTLLVNRARRQSSAPVASQVLKPTT